MFGQYPHGIDLHVRNLKWALTKDDHVYIVTLPKIIEDFKLESGGNVTYIPFHHIDEGDFINFWAGFPGIIKNLNIKPQWFQFMEGDIWFHKKPGFVPRNPKEIANYLPLQTHYHAVMAGNKLLQPRVWEGGTLVHGDVVRRAIDNDISFSFVKEFFCEFDPDYWEDLMGGRISLRYFKAPDTFDEFNLYCALIEKSKICHFDRAVHLRGPESLHRKFPHLYNTCTDEQLVEPSKVLPYLCVYGAIAPYYIDGHWKGMIQWHKMKPEFQKEFVRLLPTASEWMKPEEYVRLVEITEAIRNKDHPLSNPAPASPSLWVRPSKVRNRRIRGRWAPNRKHL